MYEPVQILCIEWKQTLTKVLQLHTRAHLEQCLHSDAEGDGRWKLEAGAVGCSCPSLSVFTCTFGSAAPVSCLPKQKMQLMI